jgi:hypothetical protein
MTQKISPHTKIRLLLTFFFQILPNAAFRISGAFVRAWLKGLPLGPSMWNGFAGALMIHTRPRDLQSILPSTIETYNTWTSSHNTAHTVDVLAADNSTRLLWIGPKKAKNVVLFFMK